MNPAPSRGWPLSGSDSSRGESGQRAIRVGGREIPVRVRRNDRARRLTLRFSAGGEFLKLTLPPHAGAAEAAAFLERSRDWIASRLSSMPAPVIASDGCLIPYRGRNFRIASTGSLRGVVREGERGGESVLFVPGGEEALGRRLLSFMRKSAKASLEEAVSRHACGLGVRPRAIRIADATSRWGSCSSSRTLSFSWRIVMAPPEALDYLAAHEVAHLREMNHGPAFWSHVRSLCPDMENQRLWLRENAARLHAVRLG